MGVYIFNLDKIVKATDLVLLKKPKKKPKSVSTLPIPEYFIVLDTPLLIISIRNITTTNIPAPKTKSNTYWLSITSFTYGLILGKRIRVTTYANNHLEADSILKTKPLEEHFIKDQTVITK